MKCTFKFMSFFLMLLLWVHMLAFEIENQNNNIRSKKSWRRKSKKNKKKYKKIKNLMKIEKDRYQEMKKQLKTNN